jgi:hypothetical protein
MSTAPQQKNGISPTPRRFASRALCAGRSRRLVLGRAATGRAVGERDGKRDSSAAMPWSASIAPIQFRRPVILMFLCLHCFAQ